MSSRSRRLASLALLLASLAGGCAELQTTGRIMNIALMELFRLPVYLMRVPFQILSSLGPIIQSAVRTAANMAPLLLFIDNRKTGEKLYAGPLGDAVDAALASARPEPILPVLETELDRGGAARFMLVDARLAADPLFRRALLESFPEGGRGVRCVPVDGGGLLREPGRFVEACRRMRGEGGGMISLTPLNGLISAASGIPEGLPPADPELRRRAAPIERALEGAFSDAHREG